jgi:hypothetical protein
MNQNQDSFRRSFDPKVTLFVFGYILTYILLIFMTLALNIPVMNSPGWYSYPTVWGLLIIGW